MNALETFDQERRLAAAEHGSPLPRMELPSVAVRDEPVCLVWLRGGKLMSVFADPPDYQGGPWKSRGEPTGCSTQRLRNAFHESQGYPLVLADARTRKTAVRALERGGGDREANIAALIGFSQRLSTTTRVVMLDEALQRKFWLPDGLPLDDLGSWRKAFGFSTGHEALVALFGRTRQGDTLIDGDEAGTWPTLWKQIRSMEQKALKTALTPSPSAAVECFQATESLSEAWDAYQRFDPLLRFRFIHDGTVVRFDPIGREHGTAAILGKMSQPCKLREADMAILPDGPGADAGRASLASVSFDAADGELIGHLVPVRSGGSRGHAKAPRKSNKDFRPVDGALIARHPILVTASPFLSRLRRMPMGGLRWVSSRTLNAVSVEGEVPLDIMVAAGSDG